MICKLAVAIASLDIASKISTVIIAAGSLSFTIFIFIKKNKRDDDDKERERRVSWLKTLVLDHNLHHFYDAFDEIEMDLEALKVPNLTDDQKKIILDKVGDHFIKLRRKFIDMMIAINKNLYQLILEKSDTLQSSLSTSIFDVGVNLAHGPKYDEIITEKLTTAKTDIIKCIFAYNG